MSEAIEPFRIEIEDAVLDDLRARLRRTRWPEPLDDPGWDYGVEQGALRELARAWAEDYDWRAHEARLDALPQFRTWIDGCRVHFAHVRSPEPDALPLVVSHGWPGSFAEFAGVIGPLSDPRAHGGDPRDAFHVVCPSLPGYGFSTPTNLRGWNPRRIARAFSELMRRLGYARYGAQGGDWGSFVSQFVAREDPQHCVAIHLNFLFAPPLDPAGGGPGEQAKAAAFQRYVQEESGYAQIQSTRPETLGYALCDSPVGQLAWIAEKFRSWTDCDGVLENAVSRDELLTIVTLYWVTATGGSSGRLYRETRLSDAFGPQPRLETPLGFAAFPKEVIPASREAAERLFNVVHWTEMPRGGHFAALEQPQLLVEDVRRFFRRFR